MQTCSAELSVACSRLHTPHHTTVASLLFHREAKRERDWHRRKKPTGGGGRSRASGRKKNHWLGSAEERRHCTGGNVL
uniref:DUF834 domain-containing protein n=1 Tax=Oryza rufipogon TaxID=4529 RepID=A0A0E0QLW0_ORYRU